jgi:hypothetical protein
MNRKIALVAVLSTAIGIVLAVTIDLSFLALAALGMFGPGLLRELGLFRDRDEFGEQASLRAGYRAYLAGGLLLVLMLVARGGGTTAPDSVAVPAVLVLATMLVVYLMSYLFGFWGTRRGSSRMLLAFGVVWLLFVVLSHATEPVALLSELIVPLPILALAFTALRWPRATGLILLGLGAFAVFFFNLQRALSGDLAAQAVAVLLLLPVMGTGVALLASGSGGPVEREAPGA